VCNPLSLPIIDSSNACNEESAPVVCSPLHGPVQFVIHRVVRIFAHIFPQKLPFTLPRSSPPRNTLFLGPSSLIVPNGILIGSAVFLYIPNAMLYNVLSTGKKIPKLPLFLVISSPCRRRTELRPCNMHKNWVEITVWFRIYPRGDTDRQTDTQTRSSQYFATAPDGQSKNQTTV